MDDTVGPSPLGWDTITLHGSDAFAFNDLGEREKDVFVSQYLDKRAVCSDVSIEYDYNDVIIEVECAYVPDS